MAIGARNPGRFDPSILLAEGIEAVSVDVVVDGGPCKGRCVRDGSLGVLGQAPGPGVGTPPAGSGVQVPLRKRAPDRLRSENLTHYSYIDHVAHLAIDNQTQ